MFFYYNKPPVLYSAPTYLLALGLLLVYIMREKM
jgi:hypothetical protein